MNRVLESFEDEFGLLLHCTTKEVLHLNKDHFLAWIQKWHNKVWVGPAEPRPQTQYATMSGVDRCDHLEGLVCAFQDDLTALTSRYEDIVEAMANLRR